MSRPAPRPGRRRRRLGRRTRPASSGDSSRRQSPSRSRVVLGVALGNDLGLEAAVALEPESLVLVVEDHQVAEHRREILSQRLELLDQPRLGVLAALLEGQRQVVHPSRCILGVRRRDLRPVCPRAHSSAAAAYPSSAIASPPTPTPTVSSGAIPAASIRSSVAVGSSGRPACSRAASANAARDLGRVVDLDQLGGALDDLGL